MHQVFLSLGSNLGNRLENLKNGVDLLGTRTGIVTAVSPVYETEPWGCMHDVNFLNLAVLIKTRLGPHDLLAAINETERFCGRDPAQGHNAPRTLDIDVLFYDKRIINTQKLTIPHPFLHLRRFVLVPLAEIAPDFIHPLFKISVSQLLADCSDDSMTLKVT
jgi:2-amino-4-hydroxy-6-hydroxymethyldihydropteridine diphosphokinase